MPHKHIKEQNVDIFAFPDSQREVTTTSELSIGDLHANAIKLIHFLYKENVIDMSKDNFNELVNFYKKDREEVKKSDLDRFEAIIASINLKNKINIRLIGDILADRGQNDYYILFILNLLKKKGLKFEVLLSNHDIEFIKALENKTEFESQLGPQAKSLFLLQEFINNKLVERDKVESLTINAYLPSLKLLSYSLDRNANSISIHSHAAIDLDIISRLAKLFKIKYEDASIDELARTIERINYQFQTQYVATGKIHTLIKDMSAAERPDTIPRDDPVLFLIWSRQNTNTDEGSYFFKGTLKRDQVHRGYNVFYIHGHDSTDVTRKNIINIDNVLGKSLSMTVGEYTLLASDNTQLNLSLDELQAGLLTEEDLIEQSEDSEDRVIPDELFEKSILKVDDEKHGELIEDESRAERLLAKLYDQLDKSADPEMIAKTLKDLSDERDFRLQKRHDVLNEVLKSDNLAILQKAYESPFFGRHSDDAKTREALNKSFSRLFSTKTAFIPTNSQKQLKTKMNKIKDDSKKLK